MRSTADVVVVGGGIIGCAVATELATAGAGVVLAERAEIASAASGRNHGLLFHPQEPVAGPLYRASLESYRELASDPLVDVALDDRPCGFLLVVSEEAEWTPAEREAQASARGGVEVERLDASRLGELEPRLRPGPLGAYLIHDGYRVDPGALTLACVLEARRAGAEVLTHTEVKQVRVRAGRVVGVVTDRGSVEAPVVVNAAGPWAPKVARTAGVELPVAGARGWLLLTGVVDWKLRHLIISPGWHPAPGDPGPPEVTVEGYARGELPRAEDIGLLVQQDRSGRVLLGGSRLASLREDPEGSGVTREIARRAVEMVPALCTAPIRAVWSGVRPMSPDGLPLIGWTEVEGLFVAGGHGGRGVSLGAGTARLTAQMVLGAPPFTDPAPFAPHRFSRSAPTA
jgi:glycine/D-amino acid oxidase-like deaminating enzyme